MARPVTIVAGMQLPLDASDISGLGTAAYVDVPASGDAANDQAVLGSDSRLPRYSHLFEGTPISIYSHSFGYTGGTPNLFGSGSSDDTPRAFTPSVASTDDMRAP